MKKEEYALVKSESKSNKMQTKNERKRAKIIEKDNVEQETDYEEEENGRQIKPQKGIAELQTIYIDSQLLPYIFRYKYQALKKLMMKKDPAIPRIAYEIFDYITKKVVVRRTFYSSKYQSRMKYEEKIKFLMRAFIYRRSIAVPGKSDKIINFNKQNQIQFFKRKDVRDNFLEEINHAIVVKEVQNERLIKHFEECITFALKFSDQEYQKAKLVVDNRVKRRQLPWTQNMFKDMKSFSNELYHRYTGLPQKELIQEEEGRFDENILMKFKESNTSGLNSIKKQVEGQHNQGKIYVKRQSI